MIKDLISQFAYIDDLSLLGAGRNIINFMLNTKANSIICTDPKVQKAINSLNWDLTKSGCENILKYFDKRCP